MNVILQITQEDTQEINYNQVFFKKYIYIYIYFYFDNQFGLMAANKNVVLKILYFHEIWQYLTSEIVL